MNHNVEIKKTFKPVLQFKIRNLGLERPHDALGYGIKAHVHL